MQNVSFSKKETQINNENIEEPSKQGQKLVCNCGKIGDGKHL